MKIQNLLIIASLVFIPFFVLANGLIPCTGNECTLEDIPALIYNVIDFIFKLAGIVGVLMLIIGGIYFLLAGPNPEFIEKGRKAIIAVIIALLIIFLARVLLNAFLQSLGRLPV